MWIETCNATGQNPKWFNLARMDRVEILGTSGENYVQIKLTQGATSVTTHISNTVYQSMMLYLRSFHDKYKVD